MNQIDALMIRSIQVENIPLLNLDQAAHDKTDPCVAAHAAISLCWLNGLSCSWMTSGAGYPALTISSNDLDRINRSRQVHMFDEQKSCVVRFKVRIAILRSIYFKRISSIKLTQRIDTIVANTD